MLLARKRRPLLLFAAILIITSCWISRAYTLRSDEKPELVPRPSVRLNWNEQTSPPLLLSQLGVFTDLPALTPTPGLMPYEINAPFWSDGSGKHRWISVPPEAPPIVTHPSEPWQFPVGTVLVKHFELGEVRLETRVLQVGTNGVFGATYRWRADNSDADLVSEGVRDEVAFATGGEEKTQPYYFPGPQDCNTCHNPQSRGVLGINTRQLNRSHSSSVAGENQLVAWSRLGLLDKPVSPGETDKLPRLADVSEESATVEHRVRSYLDVNCAFCHQPGGATGNFDARFATSLAAQNLINGRVVLNLGIDDARVVAPNDPWRSMLLLRLTTLDAGLKMPPVGHEVIDHAGADLVKRWIVSMEGLPVTPPPELEPAGGEFQSSATIKLRHPDPDTTIYYTLNGLPPGEKSLRYTGEIITTRPVTIRACAIKPGNKKSIGVKGTFVVNH